MFITVLLVRPVYLLYSCIKKQRDQVFGVIVGDCFVLEFNQCHYQVIPVLIQAFFIFIF